MKWMGFTLVAVLIIGGGTFAAAGEVGRYQMVSMSAENVFVIDTAEGHLWAAGAAEGTMTVLYFGKVRPGKKIGDTIESYSVPRAGEFDPPRR